MRSFYNMSDTYLKKRIRQENRKRGIKFIGIFIAIFLLPIGILVADFHNIWANPERLVIWFFVYVILLFVLCAYLEIRYIPPYRRADHQYYHLSIKRDSDTGQWEFDPEEIVSAVTWDRNSGLSYSDKEDMEKNLKKYNGSCNAAIISDNKARMRIYGTSEELVLEICFRKGRDYETFHMSRPKAEDTVIPLQDEQTEKTKVLQNSYSEYLPVKTSWLVSNQMVIDFLTKLYAVQDSEKAMQGFEFENTTELVHRLYRNNAYIVPMEMSGQIEAVQESKLLKSIQDRAIQIALNELEK